MLMTEEIHFGDSGIDVPILCVVSERLLLLSDNMSKLDNQVFFASLLT